MKRWDVVATAPAVLALVAATARVAISVRALPEALPESLIAIAVASPSIVLGILVARRIPTNPVGAVLALIGTLSLVDLAVAAWGESASSDRPVAGAEIGAVIAEPSWMLHYVGPILLALVFPTGQLLAPAWRWAAAAPVVIPVGFGVALALVPPEFADLASVPFLVGFLATLITAAASIGVRYRRGDEQQRRQLRWLLVSVLAVPLILVFCAAEYFILGTTIGVGVALALLVVALPVSVAVAMLRHALWGYDRLLAGTVRWAIMVAVVAAIFAVTVLVLGLILGAASPVAAAIATLIAALVARPLHLAVRSWIDARFQPRRERVLRAVREFVTDVRDGRAEPEQLQEVLTGARSDIRVVMDAGRARLTPQPGVELGVIDLREVESEARLPLELARLRADLRDALRQTDASRARLVATADDERRRIQRDLHDGAQSNLVALGMRLRSLQRHAQDAATLDAELSAAVELVQRTISDLRSLAQGVRPSSLDEGLEPALRAMVRSVPLPVDLELADVYLAEPQATAAYYLAAEAVTNALKHARPHRITISLRRAGNGVTVAVGDDGAGGDADTIGSGLAGVRDRVEAAGGHLHISSVHGSGTVIEAMFP